MITQIVEIEERDINGIYFTYHIKVFELFQVPIVYWSVDIEFAYWNSIVVNKIHAQ